VNNNYNEYQHYHLATSTITMTKSKCEPLKANNIYNIIMTQSQ